MNTQLRNLAVLTMIMFLLLAGAGTSLQVFRAESLNADARNTRSLYRELGQDRGPIIIADQSVAVSTEVDDAYSYQRSYTTGSTYAHVTGYFAVHGQSTGIEAVESGVLNGTDDSLFFNRIQDIFTGRQQKGGSVELTIDPAVQKAAVEGFGSQKGAAVAINPKTGEILAMVSLPSYDPNKLATHSQSEFLSAFTALNDDPDHPLVNRAIAGNTYPPGSVFKLVTAATALESGNYTPETRLSTPRSITLPNTRTTLGNSGGGSCGSDNATLAHSLAVSCNTGFANLGLALGNEQIAQQAKDFGYNSSMTIPLRVTPSQFPEQTDGAQLALSSIGQYEVRVTPLQVAMTTAAIANDGSMMKPYLVRTIRSSDLSIVQETKPDQMSQPISEETAEQLTSMMIDVVQSGTGTPAQISGIKVAGKTGTAEHQPNKPPHTWFTAFAPADDPTIVVAVVVENGGDKGNEATGARVAAPIARSMIQTHLAGGDQ